MGWKLWLHDTSGRIRKSEGFANETIDIAKKKYIIAFDSVGVTIYPVGEEQRTDSGKGVCYRYL